MGVVVACACAETPGIGDVGETEDSQGPESSATEAGSAESGSESGSESDSSGGGMDCPFASGELPVLAEGDFLAQQSTVDGAREYCSASLHAIAGAAASTLRLTLEASPQPLRVRSEDLLGEVEQGWVELSSGSSIDLTLERTGETLLRFEPSDPQAAAHEYSLSLSCVTGCGLDYTRYPVLFMHGMAGTDAYFGALDYFFSLEDYLSIPGFEVRMGVVDAFGTVETRAPKWQSHIDEMIDSGLGRKVNLVGHSQGALDARWIAAFLDEERRIASIVSVGTPHHGTSVADLANGSFDAFNVDPLTLNAVVSALGSLAGLTGAELVEQTAGLTTEAMQMFNIEVLDVPGVYYASYSGHSCRLIDLACQSQMNGETVDLLFAPTLAFLEDAEGPNDGMSSVESAKWGDWQGEIAADHADEIGQIADLNNPAFDHKLFYLEELRRLGTLGL